MQADKHVLIMGCGDVGRRLAAQLHAKSWLVDAWARRGRAESFGAVQGFDLDTDTPLPASDAVLCVYLVPPPRQGQSDPRLQRFLSRYGARMRHLVYAGTSGVYGDCDGRWVDETAPLNPADDRAKRRADAEQQVSDWAHRQGATAVRLRLAGIYGPQRLPRKRIERGDAVVEPGQATWSNRVHVDDVVRAIEAALGHRERMQAGESLAVNVADGAPSTMTDYLQACAQAMGLPALPELPLEAVLEQASPALRGYLTQSRRLCIERLRTVLKAPPQHGDFRAALAAMDRQALR